MVNSCARVTEKPYNLLSSRTRSDDRKISNYAFLAYYYEYGRIVNSEEVMRESRSFF